MSARSPRTTLPVPSEEQEQRTLAAWLDLHKILWCHVPNGGERSKAVAGKLRVAGVKAGVPDVLVFDPPLKEHVRRRIDLQFIVPVGVAIEIKRRKPASSSVTDAQSGWLRALGERGWITRVCYGAGEAITLLESLGYGRLRT